MCQDFSVWCTISGVDNQQSQWINNLAFNHIYRCKYIMISYAADNRLQEAADMAVYIKVKH